MPPRCAVQSPWSHSTLRYSASTLPTSLPYRGCKHCNAWSACCWDTGKWPQAWQHWVHKCSAEAQYCTVAQMMSDKTRLVRKGLDTTVQHLQEYRAHELEARIAAKTEQLRALENKVQALEALQQKQLRAAAALKQLRLTESQANKPQLEGREQWGQQSLAFKDETQPCLPCTAPVQAHVPQHHVLQECGNTATEATQLRQLVYMQVAMSPQHQMQMHTSRHAAVRLPPRTASGSDPPSEQQARQGDPTPSAPWCCDPC
ncbi:hypothetical protein COO60DRAFT_653462 [Scenedesmus sp. NREL 46B-D3]|nr:hypothetical protein COO60DRAFT_653462 [Scenedesmus sp. NREL 46B-D3]